MKVTFAAQPITITNVNNYNKDLLSMKVVKTEVETRKCIISSVQQTEQHMQPR